MKHEDLFGQLDRIIKEIKRITRENPPGPDGELDPRIVKLIAEGHTIANELDPIMRDFYRNDPKMLAAWDEVILNCKDLDEENGQ